MQSVPVIPPIQAIPAVQAIPAMPSSPNSAAAQLAAAQNAARRVPAVAAKKAPGQPGVQGLAAAAAQLSSTPAQAHAVPSAAVAVTPVVASAVAVSEVVKAAAAAAAAKAKLAGSDLTKPKKRKARREGGEHLTARQRKDRDDDRVVREALRSFFASSKGRPEESIRRVKDSILTVLAMNDECDSHVLARYLNVRSTDMERRLGNARQRVAYNRNIPKKDWRWSERSAVRKDSYSTDKRSDATTFWKSPAVSKLIGGKVAKNGEPRYQQLISLKEAHSAYVQHKRQSDPQFSCSVTWFTKQRPEEVKRMYVKPVGNRRKPEPSVVVATPAQIMR